MHAPFETASPLLGTSVPVKFYQDTRTRTFPVLFGIAKNWEQPTEPSTRE